jgi:hypothetical protein
MCFLSLNVHIPGAVLDFKKERNKTKVLHYTPTEDKTLSKK